MTSSVDAKLLKQTKFPPDFNQKVDMKKVNVEVMKKWIAGKISEILGSEDDVVIELCFNLLEGSRFPEIKVLQIQLTGFLDKDTAQFCKELWTLCLSAQSNPQGVPKELLEAKKLELIQEKIAAEKAAEEAKKRKEQERVKDQNIDNIRQRERGERGRGRGRGERGNHDYDRRPPRYSRSPPPRRHSPPPRSGYRGPPPRRDVDTYVPGGRSGRDHRSDDGRRRRSPSVRRTISRSRSASPAPPRRQRERDEEPPRPMHRRPTPNRSPAPVRRRHDRDKGPRSPRRGDRARSFTPSNTSRSRSPRRPRRRRDASISSRSRTPPPRRRRPSPSKSRSHSRSLEDRRRSGRPRRSPSYSNDSNRGGKHADDRKGIRQREHRRHGSSRSPNYSRDRSARPSKAVRRNSPSPRRPRKRSIERYVPGGRRRRNTSSVSSPAEKRRKTADSADDEAREKKHEPEPVSSSPEKPAAPADETRSPTLTANELREKLLKEKVLALRKSSSGAKAQSTHGS